MARKSSRRSTPVAAKGGRIELSADTLGKLGSKKLAELLYAASEDDPVLARKLRMELMSHDPDALAREIDRQIANLRRSRSFVDWNKIGELARTLDALRVSIAGPLTTADAAMAAERFLGFFALGPPTIERADDSSGRIESMFREATADFAAAVAAISDHDQLHSYAVRGYEAAEADGYGLLDDLTADIAQRLPPASLAMLKGYVEDKIASSPPVIEGGKLNFRSSFHASALAAIADAQDDVNLFIRAETLKGLRLRDDCGIAQRLLKAGRAAEALAHLDTIDAENRRDTFALDDVRIDVLDALGRKDEAQFLRWRAFEQRLSIEHLRGFLKRLPDFEDVVKEEAAMTFAASQSVDQALAFFMNWPNNRAAGALVRVRHSELDGDQYYLYAAAAAALETKEPLAATLLRRAMIDFTLGRARSSRYEHAARHLAECESIASIIRDWGGALDHASYVAHLGATHSRKTGFWSRVQRDG